MGVRFSRRWCSCWSVRCGLEVDDLLGGGDVEFGEQIGLGFGQGGDLLEHARGAGEGAQVEAVGGAGPSRRGGSATPVCPASARSSTSVASWMLGGSVAISSPGYVPRSGSVISAAKPAGLRTVERRTITARLRPSYSQSRLSCQ